MLKVSMSTVGLCLITWSAEEFLCDVKKIRPKHVAETSNEERRSGCVGHTCIPDVWTQRSRTKYLFWEVKMQIFKGEPRNLNF